MKYYILFLFIIFSCNKTITKNKLPKEDITTLIELSLNSCKDVKQFYNFESNRRVVFHLSFYKSKNPLNRKIKYFGIPLEDKFNIESKKDYLMTIYVCEKLSSTKFKLCYLISNMNLDVESTIEYIDNKWTSVSCNVYTR